MNRRRANAAGKRKPVNELYPEVRRHVRDCRVREVAVNRAVMRSTTSTPSCIVVGPQAQLWLITLPNHLYRTAFTGNDIDRVAGVAVDPPPYGESVDRT